MAAPVVVRPWRRRLRRLGWSCLLLALLLLALRLWPQPPLREAAPLSRVVLAENGALLRLTLASDGQYRLWVPLERFAPSLIEAMLLKEDRHFFRHPGVNPAALLRAARETWGGGMRQGGSTLSMQLARRLYGLDSRNIPGKLQQIGLALWLEARYSKRDILEAYLNLAPMGGNIEGMESASRIYFNKPAAELSLAESLALAVIPQQPGRRGHFGPSLDRARLALLAEWHRVYPDDPRNSAPLELPVSARSRAQLPFRAPHFAELLLARHSGAELHSTLSAPLQQQLERQIAQFVAQNRARGIENASALLIDSRDQSVKALVGSADYFSTAIHGQVNGVTARRSPGSTLKPFLYGLAIDQGLIHPQSILKDTPSAFGPYQPENFDGSFVGPLSARDALIRSRNVPAVWLASQLRTPNLYALLQRSGVSGLRGEEFYGLGLSLGAAEVSSEELGRLYLMLAGDGHLRPLRYLQEQQSAPGEALLSAEATFMLRDMLAATPRPDGLPADPRNAPWPVAWKTGTSWGFHDAWSAGVVGPYVLVVWVGNFDARPNPAFVGIRSAAPLFFRIADGLPLLDRRSWQPPVPPPGLSRVDICSASGDLPNRWCPRITPSWFIPGVSPIRVSTLHRPVPIDIQTGQRACPPFDATKVREEVFEFWPSDLQALFNAAGLPRRSPPADHCEQSASPAADAAPRIRSPLSRVTYSLRLSQPDETIALNASAGGDARRLYWFADQRLLGEVPAGRVLDWRPERAGRYQLSVSDDLGRSAQRILDVEILP